MSAKISRAWSPVPPPANSDTAKAQAKEAQLKANPGSSMMSDLYGGASGELAGMTLAGAGIGAAGGLLIGGPVGAAVGAAVGGLGAAGTPLWLLGLFNLAARIGRPGRPGE